MYIKAEKNDRELTMDKISDQKELINEIKALANTLSDEIKNEYNITSHQIACHYLAKNVETIDINEQNIQKLYEISKNTEQILSEITPDTPIEIRTDDCPWYAFRIELDENSKLKITATSELDLYFPWDTLIQWFPTIETEQL